MNSALKILLEKTLLLLLFFPCVAFAQNTDKEEAYKIYKCCIQNSLLDKSDTVFIKETTVYYQNYKLPISFNRIIFGINKPDYLIDSVFGKIYDKYWSSDTTAINVTDIFKNDPQIKVFSKKDYYKISQGKPYWSPADWELYDSTCNRKGVLYGLSKISISGDHRYAILYLSMEDKTGMTGKLFLCTSENNNWWVLNSPDVSVITNRNNK